MLILIGVIVAFNFLILIHKYECGRFLDLLYDSIIFIILCVLFSTGLETLVIGSIASFCCSLFLLSKPKQSKHKRLF